MTCYRPIVGWRSRTGRDAGTGKWPIVFNPREGYDDMEVVVPCGKCVGCKMDRAKQWAIRCVHEASLYEHNCFITLTYDKKKSTNEQQHNLIKRDFVLFMKRLRKENEKYGIQIRFFHCGEYGRRFTRPHHHACLFGVDFPDREFWDRRTGIDIYTSRTLEKLWPYGYHTVGAVTVESAAYCARYVIKKINGEESEKHYNGREPEYITMSRRPGIGREWYNKYKSDVYNYDLLITNKYTMRPPRYYDKLYELDIGSKYKNLKYRRSKKNIKKEYSDLKKAEEAATIKLSKKIRVYEQLNSEVAT